MLNYDLLGVFQWCLFVFSLAVLSSSLLSLISLFFFSLSLYLLSSFFIFFQLSCISSSLCFLVYFLHFFLFFACSFLSYTSQPFPSYVVVIVPSFWVLSFSWFAKGTRNTTIKACFLAEKQCFLGFSSGCSGIETLKKIENPNKGEGTT